MHLKAEYLVPVIGGSSALFYLLLMLWHWWKYERVMDKQLQKTIDDILYPKGKPNARDTDPPAR